MLFKQNKNYQKINWKKGRDCNERWDCIDKYVEENKDFWSIDIGAAEGYFSKKILEKTKGRVLTIEGSNHVYKRQAEFCKEEILNGKIINVNIELTDKNIDFFTERVNFEYCILFSVLHWFGNPDYVFKKLADVSNFIFIELPELDDKKAWNQDYLKRISKDFETLENYIETISGKKILSQTKVSSHTSEYRRVFVLN